MAKLISVMVEAISLMVEPISARPPVGHVGAALRSTVSMETAQDAERASFRHSVQGGQGARFTAAPFEHGSHPLRSGPADRAWSGVGPRDGHYVRRVDLQHR